MSPTTIRKGQPLQQMRGVLGKVVCLVIGCQGNGPETRVQLLVSSQRLHQHILTVTLLSVLTAKVTPKGAQRGARVAIGQDPGAKCVKGSGVRNGILPLAEQFSMLVDIIHKVRN